MLFSFRHCGRCQVALDPLKKYGFWNHWGPTDYLDLGSVLLGLSFSSGEKYQRKPTNENREGNKNQIDPCGSKISFDGIHRQGVSAWKSWSWHPLLSKNMNFEQCYKIRYKIHPHTPRKRGQTLRSQSFSMFKFVTCSVKRSKHIHEENSGLGQVQAYWIHWQHTCHTIMLANFSII